MQTAVYVGCNVPFHSINLMLDYCGFRDFRDQMIRIIFKFIVYDFRKDFDTSDTRARKCSVEPRFEDGRVGRYDLATRRYIHVISSITPRNQGCL